MKLLTVLLILVGSACAENACTTTVGIAVLDTLYDSGHFRNSYNRMNVGGVSKHSLDLEQQEINCVHTFANSVKDPEQKAAYLCWLEYYQSNLQEAYTELSQHTQQHDQDSYEAKQAAQQKRVAAYKRAHPVPVPPSCRKPERMEP